jgi:hypothetical protein
MVSLDRQQLLQLLKMGAIHEDDDWKHVSLEWKKECIDFLENSIKNHVYFYGKYRFILPLPWKKYELYKNQFKISEFFYKHRFDIPIFDQIIDEFQKNDITINYFYKGPIIFVIVFF